MEDSRYVWISIPAAQLENTGCREQRLSLRSTLLQLGVILLDRWPCLFLSWPLEYNTAFHILCLCIFYFLITWACACTTMFSVLRLESIQCWVFGVFCWVFLSAFLVLLELLKLLGTFDFLIVFWENACASRPPSPTFYMQYSYPYDFARWLTGRINCHFKYSD